MSITSDRRFVQDLAQAAVAIFDGGCTTTSAAQIAAVHFKDRSYNFNVVYDVQHHLRRIKQVLDKHYELPVVLVHSDAYKIIKKGGPLNRTDAVKCLPGGKGRVSDGLHLCNSLNDLIYETSIELNLRRAAGKEKRNMDRLLETQLRGHLTDSTLAAIADDIAARREVANPAALAAIIRERQRGELESLAALNGQ